MLFRSIDKIYELVNGIDYSRDIPKEAELLAKNNNIIIIVGGSDDLMYCYGAESYLTRRCEHGYGWDGSLLQNIHDKNLEYEAEQLGLEIYWCGKILDKYENILKEIEDYDIKKMGAFSYKVKEGIKFKNFIVYEDFEKYGEEEVYCTGIIIELPKGFESKV